MKGVLIEGEGLNKQRSVWIRRGGGFSTFIVCGKRDEHGFWRHRLRCWFFSGTDMLSKLMKMQVLEDDEELAYGGDDTPGTERKDIEVRLHPIF